MKALYVLLQMFYSGVRGATGIMARKSILGSDIRHTVSSTDALFLKISSNPSLVRLLRSQFNEPYIQIVHRLRVAREIGCFPAARKKVDLYEKSPTVAF